jgi:anti-anti-sigma factor
MNTTPDELMIMEEEDGVHVVRLLSEALLDPVEIDRVEVELFRLIERDAEPRLVIALDTVDHVSSLMISSLIKIRKAVDERAGQVCLAAVPPRLRQLFEIVKLGDLFTSYDTTAQAVRALQAGR